MKLPPAFKLLLDERNPAADSALVEALPHLDPLLQSVALEMLIRRNHAASLAALVGTFTQYDDLLQQLLIARAEELAVGMRSAINAPTFEERANAIELVVLGDETKSAYLLIDALRPPCVRTRERAALGLKQLTECLLARLDSASMQEDLIGLYEGTERLAEALASGVSRWESHSRPEILHAALLLGDHTESAILDGLAQPRSKLAKALGDVLSQSPDPRLAGAALRGLAVPGLRPAAVDAIRRGNAPFFHALFSHAWLLADGRIERECRWVRLGTWQRAAVQALAASNGVVVTGGLRFLASVGGSADQKADLFRELLGFDREEVRRATLWQLLRQQSDTALRLLRAVASREQDALADPARRELQYRQMIRGNGAPTMASQPRSAATPEKGRARFERYWRGFDRLGPEKRLEEGRALRSEVKNLDVLLRVKLTSPEPLDRARALRIILSLGLVQNMEASFRRAASDSDPVVRSLAVNTLVELPGPVTIRLLRAAVNDPDERVQADAIEALDRLDVPERVACTEPKLKSTNNRVRANAVKSLLRTDHQKAGETLLSMLKDPLPVHRFSALWVVEQLRLRTAAARVQAMSHSDPDVRVKRSAQRVSQNIARGESLSAQYELPALAGKSVE